MTPGELDAQSPIYFAPRTLSTAGVENARLIKANSILVCCIGSLGKTGVAGRDLVTNQQINSIKFDETKILHRYGFHACRQLKDRLISIAPATTIPIVSKSKFAELKIPVPPISQQRRIAAILDKADALRAKRREALFHLDRLAQSIFVEMFGDPMLPTSLWEPVPVSAFVAGFESGKSVAAEDEEDATSPYRVLKVSAVTSLEFKPDESKAAPPDHIPQDLHFVRPGDLLFSRANTTELIGATAYVSEVPENLLLPDKLWRFVWHPEPRATPQFVNYLFRQKKFRSEIGRRASGSSGSMKNISQEKVLSIEVSLPPISMQKLFSERIAKIMAMKAALVPATENVECLFSAIQNRAFRGEL